MFSQFASRRSAVHGTDGMIACTQPLAARCGLHVLNQGGNAADAAVAVAAGLNMTEPGSTGIGGDMFCLYYDAETKRISSLNGSGRSGSKCSLENVKDCLGISGHGGDKHEIPLRSVHAVTVPGAAAGWVDTIERFGSGKLSLEQILMPAISLGENGFPVHEVSAYKWAQGESLLRNASPNFAEMLKKTPGTGDGYRAPRSGELMTNTNLAATFRALAKSGKAGFYTGRIAEAIVKVCRDQGGLLELADLEKHMALGTQTTDPISLRISSHNNGVSNGATDNRSASEADDVDLWEHPPNGQGIIALMALGILAHLEDSGSIPPLTPSNHNSPEVLHAIIESLRIAFADGRWWVCDPDHFQIPIAELTSKAYSAERAKLFNPKQANGSLQHGDPSPAHQHCDTVYFCVTDRWGNGISFINSNYDGFGTGIIPSGCGFTLQNRGANFDLREGHPNVLAPDKRPYHTIIPAMVTNASDGSLNTVYGVMGGFMQPQGHVQVLLNMLRFGMNPQTALDAPRICISAFETAGGGDGTVWLEEGIDEHTVNELRRLGHTVEVVTEHKRSVFGRGQVIRCSRDDGKLVYSGGSDLRGDGAVHAA